MKNLSIERMGKLIGSQEYAGQCFFAIPLWVAATGFGKVGNYYESAVVELCWNS